VADAVVRLLRDPMVAADLAEAARESCGRYRWESVRAQWVDLYRGLTSASALPEPRPV
jgi:glycosyltransferase involved in cell wall biosynthesis